jgi:hypothetical protein
MLIKQNKTNIKWHNNKNIDRWQQYKKINNPQASHFNHKVELQTLNEHPKNTIEEATKKSIEENGLNYKLWLKTKRNIVPTLKKQDKKN